MEAETRAVEREEEAAVLEAEAAAAEKERAEEAENAPVQLDASHFEVEEEVTEEPEATVEPVAIEASAESTEAAPTTAS